MACCNNDFWEQELERLQQMAASVGSAIIALESGAVQSYTLDTGQTRVTKTMQDLSSLRLLRQSLLNEISVLEIRLGKCPSTTYARPAF